MQGQLFWPLDDDVFSGRVPPNHVVVVRALQQPATSSLPRTQLGDASYLRVQLGEKRRLRLCVGLGETGLLLLGLLLGLGLRLGLGLGLGLRLLGLLLGRVLGGGGLGPGG